jgi:hypothetical protein
LQNHATYLSRLTMIVFVQVYDIVNVAGPAWQDVGLVLDSNIYPRVVTTAAVPAITTTTTPASDTRVANHSAGPPATTAAAAATVIEPVGTTPVAASAAVTKPTVKQESGSIRQGKPAETMTQLIEAALKEARVIHQTTLEVVEAELEAKNIKTR